MSESLATGNFVNGYGHPEPAQFQGLPTAQPDTFFQLQEDPELILRRQRMPPRGFNYDEHFALLADSLHEDIEVLQVMHNDYGLNIPGFIVVGPVNPGKDPSIYTATQRVHGTYFSTEHLIGTRHGEYQLDKIPEKVTEEAFDRILCYYEDVAAGKIDRYLADLRLGNLMYGRLQGDYKDDIYAFDFEKSHFFDTTLKEYWPVRQIVDPKHYGGMTLISDFREMKWTYGKDYAEFDGRLKALLEAAINHP